MHDTAALAKTKTEQSESASHVKLEISDIEIADILFRITHGLNECSDTQFLLNVCISHI